MHGWCRMPVPEVAAAVAVANYHHRFTEQLHKHAHHVVAQVQQHLFGKYRHNFFIDFNWKILAKKSSVQNI